MAGALADAVRAALGTRTEPLQRRTLVDVGLTDHERVGVELEVVRRVGDGAVQHLAHGLARRLGRVVQDRTPIAGGFAQATGAGISGEGARASRGWGSGRGDRDGGREEKI